ncbi:MULTISPECIES: DJ-1 family glyoxalase III [unclassified Oceanispirochaeta]|uniref:DJ-1 family glyoxalase III n=1 Tax=unclassified Oceanispirochaeta TaxID=2635722 RepID=UPI000E09D000|nr:MULTISPECIES: DJ-1 family glyoxalase III [unclassified Oceanispirochaeta]MBF9014736.1 DJ-1/PfpI family protein [Oceanispirochaeta sp. M2]NPD70992.1 DJ-1/PfpI family protein [Oceanispirochaeta sp. M1]RDG33825.1 DJ-1/PfpI family protein [Oceanispirochaeta sp. M1]
MKSVAVILADGLEEVEAITPIDFLRRAGIDVTTVALKERLIEGSHGVHLKADVLLNDFPEEADAILIPGGMPGSAHIAADPTVIDLVKKFHDQGKLVAAICAAPSLVLGAAGILKDKRYTCYPGFEDKAGPYGIYSTDRVVCDKNVITGCGVGGAAEFSREIIAYLIGDEKADTIMRATLQAGY